MRRLLITNQISHKLKTLVPLATTILFGSEARGKAGEDSDIDLLILLPDDLSNQYSELKTMKCDELFDI